MERWRDVEGYEGLYQVSNKGRVRSLDREVTKKGDKHRSYKPFKSKLGGRILKYGVGKYRTVFLSKKGKVTTHQVHVLVAKTFIPNPHNLPEVNHKDTNKKNNRVNNLEWCTGFDNIDHAVRSGIYEKKLTQKDIHDICVLLHKKQSGLKIAKIYGVTSGAVYHIKKTYFRGWGLCIRYLSKYHHKFLQKSLAL